MFLRLLLQSAYEDRSVSRSVHLMHSLKQSQDRHWKYIREINFYCDKPLRFGNFVVCTVITATYYQVCGKYLLMYS